MMRISKAAQHQSNRSCEGLLALLAGCDFSWAPDWAAASSGRGGLSLKLSPAEAAKGLFAKPVKRFPLARSPLEFALSALPPGLC